MNDRKLDSTPTGVVTGLLGVALLGSGLATLAPPAASAADEGEPTALPKIQVSVDESEGYRDDTAAVTKTGTPLRDVPQSISVVTRQQIDDQNMQNIADVVRYVPGVGMAQGEGNRETPILRGNTTTSDFYLDGIRDDVQYYRDLYNIDKVEIVKGPNGMIFGRGGAGGAINRVSKQAGWDPVRALSLQAGSYSNKRIAVDVGQPINENVAFRINGVYEDSDSHRDDVTLERYGVNPTVKVRVSDATQIAASVEYFHDERIADRGVSSFAGRPVETDPSTFFGDPDQSPTHTTVKAANFLIEHAFNDTLTLRNSTRYGDYDKFYQNVFAGAVGIDGTTVSLLAYNNAQQRENLFNQTDLVFTVRTGAVMHTLLTGLELGRQVTDNFRNTGYFDTVAPDTTTISVPLDDPRTTLPVSFRQGETEADNHGTAKIAALYLQDEMQLSAHWQVVLGLRFDQFDVDFDNHRTGDTFSTSDDLLSPRAGLVFKPIEPLSLYASYSKSYQPRAGEQLGSLSLTNAALDPEEYNNYEIGAKWDVLPNLAFTAAAYQLDRNNVAVADPNDSTRLILIDGQRTKGIELAFTGNVTDSWSIVGSYAYQDGELLSDQSATLLKGATLAQVPKNTFALWNRYDFTPAWGVGLGIVYRDEILAATENVVTPESNVTLPDYTRVDAAVFFNINDRLRAQINVENLLDEEYFAFANSNTNITPGSPVAARLSFTASF